MARRLQSTKEKSGKNQTKSVSKKRRIAIFSPLAPAGRILKKIIPKFLREAWSEIRQVSWPSRRETWRLSVAVFIFSAVFAVIVSLLDSGLDKLFKELIIK